MLHSNNNMSKYILMHRTIQSTCFQRKFEITVIVRNNGYLLKESILFLLFTVYKNLRASQLKEKL